MSVRRVDQGEYRVIIRDTEGNELRRLVRASTKRFPVIGEALDLEGQSFRVCDVRHVDEEDDVYNVFRFTDLLVIAEPEAPGKPGGKKSSDEDRVQPKPITSTVVLPFHPHPLDPASPVLALQKLVSLAVAIGYANQAQQLESLKTLAADLAWDGRQWLVPRLTGAQSAGELRELSREAKRSGAEAMRFYQDAINIEAVAPAPRLAEVVSLAAFRGR